MKKQILITLLISFLTLSTQVYALSLDQAKKQGLVGEQLDGYLGIVQSTPEVEAVVADINSKRREKYIEISKSNGTSLSNVEILAGKKAVENSSQGSYIKAPNGSWLKK